MSYVYRRSEPGLYTVGLFTPNGEWVGLEDFGNRKEALACIHYLNGGEKIMDIEETDE